MAEFRKNKKLSNFLHSKPVLVILAAIVILFAINIAGIAKKAAETTKNKNSARAKVEDLQSKETKLSIDIAKLDTPEGAEDAVREKFRVVKDGEGLVVVIDDRNAPPVEIVPAKTGFWEFIKRLFD